MNAKQKPSTGYHYIHSGVKFQQSSQEGYTGAPSSDDDHLVALRSDMKME